MKFEFILLYFTKRVNFGDNGTISEVSPINQTKSPVYIGIDV